MCLNKRIVANLKYEASHRDKVNAGHRKWDEKNPDKVKLSREKGRPARLLKGKENRKNNKKKIQEGQRRSIEKKREYYNAKKREYYNKTIKFSGKCADYTRDRRARLKNVEGRFTNDEFKSLIAFYGGRCLGCGRSDVKLEADHIVPISLGGKGSIDNIQPLCRSCNARKFKSIIDYRSIRV